LNNGVTLAHFQSSGNIPETKDLLKRSHSETEIRLKGVNYVSLGIQPISQWHVKRDSPSPLAEKITNLLILSISVSILIVEIHKD